MKLHVYLFVIMLHSSIVCGAQQPVVFEKQIFVEGNDALPYRLLYPLNYHSNTRYPLIIFLHGSGSRGNDNEAPVKNVPEAFVSDSNRSAFPCFIVVPQCPKGDVWVNFPDFPNSLKATDSPTVAGKMVLLLINDLSTKLSIDNQRLYLTGYSMGGEGTFDLLSRRPGLFAAAVPICPVADTAKAALIKDNNIWVFHGTDDKVNEVKYSRMMVDALRKQGGNPLYTEYPETGHQAWPKAYKEPDLLPWMFSKRRAK